MILTPNNDNSSKLTSEMLELAASSGEIELKYREGVRLLSVEPRELHLLPPRAAETFGTNPTTRSETIVFWG
jgi:hypothetical protein